MVPERDRNALAYAGAGISFAAIVGVMAWLGYRLDLWLGTDPWWLVGGSMVGIAVAIYDLIRTSNALERKRRERKG